MDINDKDRLARRNDYSVDAVCYRLRAAIGATGLRQNEIAAGIGIGASALNNQTRARNYPTRTTMRYFFRAHRIDFNFLIAGEYAQLPGDVQDRLWSALAIESSKPDQESSSDPAPNGTTALQS